MEKYQWDLSPSSKPNKLWENVSQYWRATKLGFMSCHDIYLLPSTFLGHHKQTWKQNWLLQNIVYAVHHGQEDVRFMPHMSSYVSGRKRSLTNSSSRRITTKDVHNWWCNKSLLLYYYLKVILIWAVRNCYNGQSRILLLIYWYYLLESNNQCWPKQAQLFYFLY